MVETLSAREARRIALHAQGLLGPRLQGGPVGVLEHLRAVQLDTISVLARSHELVAHARLASADRPAIDAALWGPGSATFEYWSHAACILPLSTWPLFSMKRRAIAKKGRRWHHLEDKDATCAIVRDRLAADGPLTARELGGAKQGGGTWFEWSAVKIAAEWLLDVGEVVARSRRGFERVYDLAERGVPGDLLGQSLSDQACREGLVASGLGALGVATSTDLAAYHGLYVRDVEATLAGGAYERVDVEGWDRPAWLSPTARMSLESRRTGRTVLLSPFDSLVWDRSRMERLFKLTYRLESYVPAHKRVTGYYAMPVLASDRLVGLVDPKRDRGVLRARHVVLHTSDAPRHVATALLEAARWVRCDDVVVERVTPTERAEELRSALVSSRS